MTPPEIIFFHFNCKEKITHRIPILQDRNKYCYIPTVSGDKKSFIRHDKSEFHKGETILRGVCDTINEKLYGLMRDDNNNLWLLSEDICPLLITDDITAEIEGIEDNKTQRKLTICKNGKICLQLFYYRDLKQIPFFGEFPEDGDFGLRIWQILNDPESRAYAWTDRWYNNAHISGDPVS